MRNFLIIVILFIFWGCSKKAHPVKNEIIDHCDLVNHEYQQYQGEMIDTTVADFTLRFNIDFYFFVDTTTFVYPDLGAEMDKINKHYQTARVEGDISEVLRFFEFQLRNVYLIHDTLVLEDLYMDIDQRRELIQREVDTESSFNVLVFNNNSMLNGFAPMIYDLPEDLERSRFKNAWVSYGSFSRFESTISHEIGHLLGLGHVFDASEEKQETFGFKYEDNSFNIMNYNCYSDHFTIEQLSYMYEYAIKYRSDLIL